MERALGQRQRAAMAFAERSAAGGVLGGRERVTLNFHPDRHTGDGVPLLERMAHDGGYVSQFVTGTSNGGLTAHPGGERWEWESRIFGGHYDDAAPAERPVYGALDRRRGGGGAPRFGSSYFRLTAAVLGRTTFCYPDSSARPTAFGTARRFALAGLADAGGLNTLDGHIEAHVHGPVRFARDAEALVLDACYRGTAVERAAGRLGCPVEWHPGFRLTVAQLRRHPGFRGPEAVELGARIARDGLLDPRAVGDAARSGAYDPRVLKWLWHCLARFGAAGVRGGDGSPGPAAVSA